MTVDSRRNSPLGESARIGHLALMSQTTEGSMKLLLALWLSFVGYVTYTLFTGLVNGMATVDIIFKRLLVGV